MNQPLINIYLLDDLLELRSYRLGDQERDLITFWHNLLEILTSKKAVNQDYRLNESTKMYNSLRQLSSTTGYNKAKSKGQYLTMGHPDHARCYLTRQ